MIVYIRTCLLFFSCFLLLTVAQAQFTPASLPGLRLWLSADTGVTLSGTSVTQWNDISGNNYHCTQPNPGAQPQFVATNCLINNKPSIKFDGINDSLIGQLIPGISDSSISVFILASGETQTTAGTNAPFFSINQVSNGFWVVRRVINQTYGLLTNNVYVSGTTASAPNAGFNFRVHQVIKRLNNDVTLYINNNAVTLSNSTNPAVIAPFTNAPYQLAKGPGNAFFKGDIAEILVYDKALNNSERQQVLNYLYNKYAPPVDLGPAVWNEPYTFCRTLSAGCGYTSYAWSTLQNTPSITVSNPGTYRVTVTDVFGRTSNDSITVSFPSVSLNINDTTICLGSTVLLTPVVPPGPYTFTWQNNSTGSSFIANQSGSYFFVANDTLGCTKTSPAKTITVDTFSVLVSLGGDTNLCAGNVIALQSPSNWNNLNFLWSTGQSTPVIPINVTGAYSVTVTNQNGCIGKDTALVTIVGNAPSIVLNGDTLCLGQVYKHNAVVTSTDTSTVNFIQWSFGNGDSSNLINPVYVYPATGNYTVTLFAKTTSGCSNINQKQVWVKAIPEAVIYSDSACQNVPRLYYHYSTAPSPDSIVAWYWTFGDGGISSSSQPTHTYTSPGNKNLQLVVTSSNGCTDTAQATVQVKTTSVSVSPFSILSPANQAVLTDASVAINWSNSSGAVKYSLFISTDSTMANPLIYPNITNNHFTVNLTNSTTYFYFVRSYSLCNDSFTTPVRRFRLVTPTSISGMQLWLKANEGVTVINGFVSHMNDFSGFGRHATQPNFSAMPQYISAVPLLNNFPAVRFDGTNDSLIGQLIAGISNSSLSIFVLTSGEAQPQLGQSAGIFTINRSNNGFCMVRRLLNQTYGVFTNNIYVSGSSGSALASGFNYRVKQVIKQLNNTLNLYINNNNVTNVISPDPLALGPFTNAPYQIGKLPDGTFYKGDVVEVIVYNKALNAQERASVLDYFYNKYTSPVELGPDIVQNYSLCPVTLNAGNRFVSYLWSTGETQPSIQVQQSGKYRVTVTDVFGRQSVDSVQVTFATPTLNLTDTIVCVGQNVTINVQTVASPALYSYLWSNALNTPSITTQLPGEYFCVISDTNGCAFTTPVATIKVDSFPLLTTLLLPDTTLCTGNLLAINTTGLTYPVSSVQWSNNTTGPVVTIGTTGYYKMIATDAIGCKNTDSTYVTVVGIIPQVNFTANSVCIGDTTFFSDLSSAVPPDNIKSWHWSFGDFTTSTLQNPQKLYPVPGLYNVTLTVVTDSGCQNSLAKTVVVSTPPLANFTTSAIICANSLTKLFDASVAFFGDTVASWIWYIGNDTLTGKNPTYVFKQQGIFPVTLVAATATGCADTAVQNVEVFGALIADFTFENVCFGEYTRFTDISPSLSVVDRLWDLGDQSSPANTKIVEHQYAQSGTYQVSLTIENAIGCKSTVTKQLTIYPTPVANFTSLTACAGALYEPVDSSMALNDSIVVRTWIINGEIYNTPAPAYTFSEPGNYPVSLKVTTVNGCKDSVTQLVNVKPLPVADFSFSPQYGAAPLSVSFNNNSQGAVAYWWIFGDGTTGTLPQPTHLYTENDTFDIYLISYSDAGCTDTAQKMLVVAPTLLDLGIDQVYTSNTTKPDGSNVMLTHVTMYNAGTRPVTSADLYLLQGNVTLLVEKWQGVLLPGIYTVHTFNAGLLMPANKDAGYVCVEAKHVNNGEPETRYDNNSNCASVNATLQLIGPITNPADNDCMLGIIVPQAGKVLISISDVHGRFTERNTTLDVLPGRTDFTIPVQTYQAGVYVISVRYNDEVINKKLVVR
ncbi:MAG: PKD domain-containing protein [Chitinophagales bacterium]|nr:PKD domain-containing protein [Chitinophagales bacterium]MDW8418241.1 PKD domain-containing protein [Chitinophagales bacterium]